MPTESALIFDRLINEHVASEEGRQDIYKAVIGMMLDVAEDRLNKRQDAPKGDDSSER